MIKRRSLLGISSNTTILRCFMAGTDLHTLSSSSLPNPYFFPTRRTCSNRRFFVNGCSSENYANSNVVLRHNAVQNLLRAAYAPPPPPFIPHQEVFWAEGDRFNILDSRVSNGAGDVHNRGKNNTGGSEDKSLPEKVMVAVDVDEVLGNFVSALNKFIAEHYSLNHSVSEYHVYEFFKIWNCSRIEADLRVHEFFKSHYFKKGIYPIPGAQKALQSLSNICNLSIVTSRQNAIKDHTINWIEEHYPGLFQEIHFGNHFALDGKSRPKSDICKSLEAKVLIDDNPKYAIECAEVGIKVLLFDYENSYPWCKTDYISHPLITKVHNWEEVEHHLASWIVS